MLAFCFPLPKPLRTKLCPESSGWQRGLFFAKKPSLDSTALRLLWAQRRTSERLGRGHPCSSTWLGSIQQLTARSQFFSFRKKFVGTRSYNRQQPFASTRGSLSGNAHRKALPTIRACRGFTHNDSLAPSPPFSETKTWEAIDFPPDRAWTSLRRFDSLPKPPP